MSTASTSPERINSPASVKLLYHAVESEPSRIPVANGGQAHSRDLPGQDALRVGRPHIAETNDPKPDTIGVVFRFAHCGGSQN